MSWYSCIVDHCTSGAPAGQVQSTAVPWNWHRNGIKTTTTTTVLRLLYYIIMNSRGRACIRDVGIYYRPVVLLRGGSRVGTHSCRADCCGRRRRNGKTGNNVKNRKTMITPIPTTTTIMTPKHAPHVIHIIRSFWRRSS